MSWEHLTYCSYHYEFGFSTLVAQNILNYSKHISIFHILA